MRRSAVHRAPCSIWPQCNDPSALNADGLPVYAPSAEGPCAAWIARSRVAISAIASSHETLRHSPSASRIIG